MCVCVVQNVSLLFIVGKASKNEVHTVRGSLGTRHTHYSRGVCGGGGGGGKPGNEAKYVALGVCIVLSIPSFRGKYMLL